MNINLALDAIPPTQRFFSVKLIFSWIFTFSNLATGLSNVTATSLLPANTYPFGTFSLTIYLIKFPFSSYLSNSFVKVFLLSLPVNVSSSSTSTAVAAFFISSKLASVVFPVHFFSTLTLNLLSQLVLTILNVFSTGVTSYFTLYILPFNLNSWLFSTYSPLSSSSLTV